MFPDFIENFLKQTKKRIDTLEEVITQGSLSHEDYKFACGELKGLNQTLENFVELMKKSSKLDDD